MGSVYEVEHEHTGQRLALKVISSSLGLPEDAVERFRTEARAAGRIRSDHVVRITDAGVAEELGRAPFLVMEMLDGADLDAVTHGVPAKPAEVVEWLRQVARGLSRAHALGIVHRDLKPENLFLTQRDDGAPLVKILDFGVAKVVAEGATQTQSGQLVGTPMYMAPEQAASNGAPISPKTDGFALGLIAFKLLVGTHYWKSGTLVQLVSQVTLEPMVAASERGAPFGAPFDEWFAKACARDPASRFAGPIEQVEALAAAFGIEPSLTPSGSGDSRLEGAGRSMETADTLAASGSVSGEKTAPTRRRTAALSVAGALLLLATVGAIVRALEARGASTDQLSGLPPATATRTDALAPALSTQSPPAEAVRAPSSAAPIDALDGGPHRAAPVPPRPPSPPRPSSTHVGSPGTELEFAL